MVDYDEMIPAAADTELAAWITGKPTGAESSWNLKPTQQIPVAYTDHKTGEKKFETAYWSLVPVWSMIFRWLATLPSFTGNSSTLCAAAPRRPENARQYQASGIGYQLGGLGVPTQTICHNPSRDTGCTDQPSRGCISAIVPMSKV